MRRAIFATVIGTLAAISFSPAPAGLRAQIPAALTDAEFWRLSGQLSEPEGFFDSDNLVSNEDEFQTVIPELARTVPKGGVYFGVGPDQNFAYILATEPRLAIITDIRRGNLRVHLLYKALFELSADRAEFLSRLFSRPRPPNVPPSATPEELFRAFRRVAPSEALFRSNVQAVLDRLTGSHRFALQSDDGAAIEQIYAEFFRGGPDLRFVSSRGTTWYPTYQDLQLATDIAGVNHGYLATERLFARLKVYEDANLIVPIVGNFGGPRALRAAGAYVRSQGATVSVFYTSNVERYLFQDGLWDAFAANVASLPVTNASVFIRSCFDSCTSPGGSRAVSLVDSIPALLADAAAGRVRTYYDVLRHSHGGQ